MGLAIDVDPAQNPYIFNEHVGGLTHEQAMWWIDTFQEMVRIATRIYGGEPIAPATMLDWMDAAELREILKPMQRRE